MRNAIGFLSAFVLAGMMLSLTGGVAAHDSFSAGHGPRLSILAPCLAGVTEQDFAASTSFWIGHGWLFGDWSQATPDERGEFMGPWTRFDLWMDGTPMQSAMRSPYFSEFDAKSKLFVTDFHGGLTGSHEFVGQWYYGGALANECSLTVNFA